MVRTLEHCALRADGGELTAHSGETEIFISPGFEFRLVGALLTPVIGAMLWPRGTAAGALCAIATGGLAVVAMLFMRGIDSDAPIYAGLGLSVAAYIIVSLASRPAAGLTAVAGPRVDR